MVKASHLSLTRVHVETGPFISLRVQTCFRMPLETASCFKRRCCLMQFAENTLDITAWTICRVGMETEIDSKWLRQRRADLIAIVQHRMIYIFTVYCLVSKKNFTISASVTFSLPFVRYYCCNLEYPSYIGVFYFVTEYKEYKCSILFTSIIK